MAPQQKDILTTFGENLKIQRNAKGLSQRELSALCNVDNADISRMENGEINVTLRTVAQLAEALEIPINKLLKPE